MAVFLLEPAFIGNRQGRHKAAATHAHAAGLGQPVPAGEGDDSRHLPGFPLHAGASASSVSSGRRSISGTAPLMGRIHQHQVSAM